MRFSHFSFSKPHLLSGAHYSLPWTPYYIVRGMTILWRIFRKNVCKPYLYFFLVTIRHNKTMCASFIFFWFFELVMLNPNQSIPLKTPRSLCVDGWDQALGLATVCIDPHETRWLVESVCIDPHETRWLVESVGFGSASLVGASGPFMWIQRQELTPCMDQAYAVHFHRCMHARAYPQHACPPAELRPCVTCMPST